MNRPSSEEKPTDTIFFDVGGVLLVDFIEQKIVDLARKYGADPSVLLALRNKHRPLADAGKISDQEFWSNLLLELGIKATTEDYEIESYMHPIPEGLQLAERLKKSGYRIAILSNDSREMFNAKRKRFALDDLFEKVIVSNELGFIKPDPQIYHMALQQMNAQPQQSVFIDDREENLAPAKELGMKTILHRSARQTEEQLKKLGIVM